MVNVRIIILLVGAIIFAVLFLAAFGYLELLPVCGVFPQGKEMLIRYYACSLVLCTHGCKDEHEYRVVERICLERDCVTGDCKKWCKSYCDDPPPSWPSNPANSGPGEICGRGYKISMPLEMEVSLKGIYGIYGVSQSVLGWRTEIKDTIGELNLREGFPLLAAGSTDVILWGTNYDKYDGSSYTSKGCTVRQVAPYVAPDGDLTSYALGAGMIKETTEEERGGDILLEHDVVLATYGCYQIPLPKQWYEIGVPNQLRVRGFSSCQFKGNLNMWSGYKDPGCGNVFINSSVSPATFELDVTPCDGKEKIRLGEEACFNAEIKNDLGTDSKFSLSITDCFKSGVACDSTEFGCDLSDGCKSNFSPNDFNVADRSFETSTLTFTPTETGEYEMWVTADPYAAYGSEVDVVTLNVVDFKVKFSHPIEQKARENDPKTYNIKIDNQLGPDDFELSYTCTGCTCQFPNGQPTYTIPLGEGISYTTIDCSSSDLGTHTISLTARAVSEDWIKPSENKAILKVVKCLGEITLSVNSPVNSGNRVTLEMGGLEDCDNEPVWFAVNYPGLETGHCAIPCDGYTDVTQTTWTKSYTANSPGSYTIYAKIDLTGDGDYNDDGEEASKTLAITAPAPAPVTLVDNTEGCVYGAENHICDQWDRPLSCPLGCWYDCEQCLDPQSCARWFNRPEPFPDILTRVADTSNICCVSGENYHSSGPGSVPCLSPDTYNNYEKTENFYWHEGDGDISRKPRSLYVPESYQGSGDTTSYNWLEGDECDNGGDCYDGDNGPSELRDASPTCNENGYCYLSCTGGTCRYSETWMFIKISETSRPVYGIRANWVGDALYVFLHKATGEWIYAGYFWTNSVIRPSGWAWDDIDAMLISLGKDGEGYLYYIGLLTKGADVPYCTEEWPYGESADYNRIVDDGKTCYWGVDCPSSGNGWTILSPAPSSGSTGLGPFLESTVCNCNSAGTCGMGYCVNGNSCYYNVQCKNGGWQGTLTECSGTCSSSGCV